ncbi:unnamed protein product [Rotaria sordida]|uniref:Uncharacterized protein n=1 Tax=Rotaria sordida TaxID=392033 RepID=A0A819NQV8_9BILA|nr:unnamed protein product [Rotaria sordida]
MIQIEDKRLTILIATTGVTSDQLPSSQNNEDQTQPPSSAMFTLWNLIADLVDTQNLKENQQQQIMDFYAKAGTIVPRLACLVQLFLNCMQILEQVKDFVVFSEGDNPNSFINENFIRNVEAIIKKDYYNGIIKNRPALGERAINELMQDNLLKYNYFLTNARGYNVKAYMKIPPPSVNDPTREEFVAKMLKHDINIDEYCAIYEKCSIPLNNNLSKLALNIFASSSCLVNQYAKYRGVLNNIIQKHVANSIIRQTDTGSFIIQNQDAFTVQFHDIENWVVGTCIEQTNNRDQPTTMIFHAPASKVTSQTTTPVKVNTFTDIVEESSVTQHHCCIEVLSNQQDINITQKSPPEHNNSFETIHNFSAMSCEQIDNVEHNSSHILVQPIVREIDEINVEGEASTSIPQSPHLKNYEKKTTNNNTQNIEKQMPHDEEEEVVHTRSQPARRKRKAETDENYGEHPQTRTQTRKLRRN